MGESLPLLSFEEAYFERIWGGTKLRTRYGKGAPVGKTIGEAWLVSDHAVHESVVAGGPLKGKTLRELCLDYGEVLLGGRVRLTAQGRFPLLLKLLDTADVLSVQVHPDDEGAAQLGEADGGKTECWYVLEGDGESRMYCGFEGGVTRDAFEKAVKEDRASDLLKGFFVGEGTSVFVAAGTVHAIGGGILLAEIQQNSDLTYRIYDWGRVGDDGAPRELHLDKALEVTRFDAMHGGATEALGCDAGSARRSIFGACRYFVAERIDVDGTFGRETFGDSFHILLGTEGELEVRCGSSGDVLIPGKAVLAPGGAAEYKVRGKGSFLTYYVADLERDVVAPLVAHGYSRERIGATFEAVRVVE